MQTIAFPRLFSSSSSSAILQAHSKLNPCYHSSRLTYKIKCSAGAEVASADCIENLSAKERRKLRNERRQQAIEAKPPWREVVKEKLLKKTKKPSAKEEMNLNKLAALGVRWWKLDVRKNSERLAAEDIQRAFATEFPDLVFEVLLPAIPSTKKLKNGAYSKKLKVMTPGCLFIRCLLNQEIHDFILSSPRVRRFSGKKVGNRTRQITKPIPVSDFDMELNFLQYKKGLKKDDHGIKAELQKEQSYETVDDSFSSEDLESGEFSFSMNADPHADAVNEKDNLVIQSLLEDFEVGDISIGKNANPHVDSANHLSDIDMNGKRFSSLGDQSNSKKLSSLGDQSNSKKLSRVFADSTSIDNANEPSLKGLKKGNDNKAKEERTKTIDGLIGQGLLEDFKGDFPTDKNVNPNADFANELSNIDISGKRGSSLGAKSNLKKLSKGLSDPMSGHDVKELSSKALNKQNANNKKDILSRKQDSKLHAGSKVKITSGPFAEFTGHLKEFDSKTGQAKVMLTMFGQETPVDVEINQVEHKP